MACSSGTSTPRSPVDGLIVPTKATIAMTANSSTLGNTTPVATIKTAPASSRLRRSCRGRNEAHGQSQQRRAKQRRAKNKPICVALKPIADK